MKKQKTRFLTCLTLYNKNIALKHVFIPIQIFIRYFNL